MKLKIGGHVVNAHRNILAVNSPYFKSMFYGNYRESGEETIDLSTALKSSSILQKLVDFMYTGSITLECESKYGISNAKGILLDEETFEDILNGASLFLLERLKNYCGQFLLENLEPKNCIYIWALASKYQIKDLATICRQVAVSRFHDLLMFGDDTLNVSTAFLSILFDDEDIMRNVDSVELAQFLHRWLEHDVERVEDISNLLELKLVKEKIPDLSLPNGNVTAVFSMLENYKPKEVAQHATDRKFEAIVFHENHSYTNDNPLIYLPHTNCWLEARLPWNRGSPRAHGIEQDIHDLEKYYSPYVIVNKETNQIYIQTEWSVWCPVEESEIASKNPSKEDEARDSDSDSFDNDKDLFLIGQTHDALVMKQSKGFAKGFVYLQMSKTLKQFEFQIPENQWDRLFLFEKSVFYSKVRLAHNAFMSENQSFSHVEWTLEMVDPSESQKADPKVVEKCNLFCLPTNIKGNGNRLAQQALVTESAAYVFIQVKFDYDPRDSPPKNPLNTGVNRIYMYEITKSASCALGNKFEARQIAEKNFVQKGYMGHYVFVGLEENVYALKVSRYNPGSTGTPVQIESVELFYEVTKNHDEPNSYTPDPLPDIKIPVDFKLGYKGSCVAIPSGQSGNLYQIRNICNLVNEMWVFNVKDKVWKQLKPPPFSKDLYKFEGEIHIAQIGSDVFQNMKVSRHKGWSDVGDEAPFAKHCMCDMKTEEFPSHTCDKYTDSDLSDDSYYDRVDNEYRNDKAECTGFPVKGYAALRGRMFLTNESDDDNISGSPSYSDEDSENESDMEADEL